MRDRHVELFSLKCVLELAHHPLPRSAATNLGIGLGSLVRRIRSVEIMLGCRLFFWERDHATVTPEAQRFVRMIEPALTTIDEAINSFSSWKTHPDVVG